MRALGRHPVSNAGQYRIKRLARVLWQVIKNAGEIALMPVLQRRQNHVGPRGGVFVKRAQAYPRRIAQVFDAGFGETAGGKGTLKPGGDFALGICHA